MTLSALTSILYALLAIIGGIVIYLIIYVVKIVRDWKKNVF